MNTTHLQEHQKIKVAGHLEEKRGIFQMALSWKLPDGTRDRKSLSTGLSVKGNKKRAEGMLRDKCAELENVLMVELREKLAVAPGDMGNMLFADFMEHRWLPVIKTEIKLTTYGGYWLNVKSVIAPWFRERGILLKNLTADNINDFYVEKLQGIKATSVHKYHANMHKALKWALQKGWIEHSVMAKVKRPKAERFVGKFLKQSEAVELFEAVKGHRLELGVILGAFYGLRRGEVVGLKWSAINFEANTVTIEHTVTTTRFEGKSYIIEDDTTKSKSSFRTLPLVPQFRAKLLELKQAQETYRKLCGNSYDKAEGQYVYVNQLGKRIKPGYLTTAFPEFLEKNGFRRMRYHDLRHSCASLLLAAGISLKQIQEWLGHSDFAITANTYAHLEFNSKLQSANAMTWIEKTSLGKISGGGGGD
ncbi:MAG: site-specific integrase [Gracilibacteraceae bacterium]|nr:site-specific integrase [Gracilibacteraceae bacterium]